MVTNHVQNKIFIAKKSLVNKNNGPWPSLLDCLFTGTLMNKKTKQTNPVGQGWACTSLVDHHKVDLLVTTICSIEIQILQVDPGWDGVKASLGLILESLSISDRLLPINY